MKKEKTPSIASVCPITPPAARENCAQFVPNWNSIGIPVTTPIAKLMPKILAQKCAARSAWRSPKRHARVFRTRINSANPIVNWGNR
jgi:hypothetical protein